MAETLDVNNTPKPWSLRRHEDLKQPFCTYGALVRKLRHFLANTVPYKPNYVASDRGGSTSQNQIRCDLV